MASVTHDDARVVNAVVDAFRMSLLIPNDGISIAASNGTVWLDGTVTWEFERMAAIDRALDVPEVGAVHNLIDVAGHPRHVNAIFSASDGQPAVLPLPMPAAPIQA